MDQQIVLVGVAIGVMVLFMVGTMLMVAKFHRKVPQGRALIINAMGPDTRVTFSACTVFPFINFAEEMDVTLKTIALEAQGREALVTKDGARVEVRALFYVGVNRTAEDVLKVAHTLGCAAASDPKRIQELFAPKFLEALKIVTAHHGADQLTLTTRNEYKDEVIRTIGRDLNGFRLDDLVLEQVDVRER